MSGNRNPGTAFGRSSLSHEGSKVPSTVPAQVEHLNTGETYALKALSKGYVARALSTLHARHESWQPLKKAGEKWNAKQCHQREERSAPVRFSLHCEALRHFAPLSCCSAG